MVRKTMLQVYVYTLFVLCVFSMTNIPKRLDVSHTQRDGCCRSPRAVASSKGDTRHAMTLRHCLAQVAACLDASYGEGSTFGSSSHS